MTMTDICSAYSYVTSSFNYIIVKKLSLKCKGQTYRTAEIILLCLKVLCLFCTVTFTSKLIAKDVATRRVTIINLISIVYVQPERTCNLSKKTI